MAEGKENLTVQISFIKLHLKKYGAVANRKI